MEVNSVYQNKTRSPLAELVIRPDTKRFSGLDFSAYKPIIEEGYKASIGPLQEWFNNQRM
jgi:predicted acylesterase/phospholipase RssA